MRGLQIALHSWQWIQPRRETEEEGQGLAEYGLILALVAAVAVAALTGLGASVVNAVGQITNGL